MIKTNESTMKSMSVNTRRGPIAFQTNLSWEDACTTLINISERTDFVESLIDRIDSGKYMSDAQCCWVYYLAEKAWEPKQKLERKKEVLADEILAALAQARAHGIRRPVVRMVHGGYPHQVKFKYMTTGSNAGGIWVTFDDQLVGKIDCNGICTAYNNPYIFNDDFLQIITDWNDNFEAEVSAQGVESGQCMCCGLPLTNELSMRLGIGPICREKYFG